MEPWNGCRGVGLTGFRLEVGDYTSMLRGLHEGCMGFKIQSWQKNRRFPM